MSIWYRTNYFSSPNLQILLNFYTGKERYLKSKKQVYISFFGFRWSRRGETW